FQWNGRPAVLCFMTDITERRQAENELKRNEILYRTLFSDAQTPIFMVDEKSRSYINANQAALDFLECNREQLIGKSVYDTTPPENLKETQKEHANFSDIKSLETYYLVNGKIKILLLQVTPLELDGNTTLIGIGQDITERKQAEAEREKLQEHLIQTQKIESIGSLAGGIAHDFNNILFPIVGLSEMMLGDFPSDTLEYHNLHEIYTAGTRGRELVQQILSFSRQSEHHKIPVHIQKILKEVLKLCRVTIPADITITKDILTNCKPVMADPTQIHQIAMNLITNAYHAVESTGGTITVQLKETDFLSKDDPTLNMTSGRYAVLSISDTGTGIDPAVINKIFDPYFTTKEKGKGTGLGLATVYGIIKAHGGDIKVHSEVGRGSSFHVYLPLMEKTQESEPEKEMIPHPTGTEHILLVDDEAPIVYLQKQMLERLGYRVTSFTSSVDALAAFRTDPSCFDLIITDMNMPNLNGMQLAEELAAIRSDIPVIICTGFSERINKEKSGAIGIKGFLMKPVDRSKMAEMVRKVLDQTKDSPQ
ncbi:MAG: response regulator, partial [Desulfobacteraceae bacterium]